MTKVNKWLIDPVHSEISFKVRHLMISHVKGAFKIFDASVVTNEKDFTTAEVDLFIDAGSITTGNEKRDEHLKAADFLDAANHKQITFTSGTIGKADKDGNHELWGDLTIKGITKQIALNVHFGGLLDDPWGNERAGFSVTGKINRNDWGLNWNAALEAGGLMVGEEIMIACEIELTNAGEKVPIMKLDTAGNKTAL